MKKRVDEVIYSSSSISYTELLALLDTIPKEYRELVQIESEVEQAPYDDYSSASLKIYYERLETDEEEEKREEEAKQWEERTKQHDLETLERLRKKYNV